MRKIVLVGALVAALGSLESAHAQSSVTMFGITDAGYGYGSGSTSSKQQVLSGGNMASRFGMRGSEDLGGGLSASFWLESGFNLDNGTGGVNNTNNQSSGAIANGGGLQFGRRSTLSLNGNWGELRMGRDLTPHYRNRAAADPFGNSGVGTIQPQAGSIAGVTSTRASNTIGYFLPSKLGGFYGQAQYYLGENPSGTATSKDGNGASVLLGYGSGPWTVSVATATTQYATTATTGDIRVANVAARYDFGVARLMLGYFKDRVERTAPLTARGYAVGTVVPVGAGEWKLAYSRYGTDAAGSPETDKWSLGYVHNLSKRTALYATAARVGNSGGASAALNGAVTQANESSHGYDLGIRHSF